MKYYLGRKINDDSYEKVDLSKVILNSEDIESIYNYVFRFNNYQELVDDLYDRGLIDTKESKFAYCSLFKGKLKPIYFGTCMYFKEAKDFFSYNNLRIYLYENKYNIKLVEYLLATLIRRYRVAESLNKSFMKYCDTFEGFKTHINYLLTKDFSEDIKNRLNTLLEYIDRQNVISIKGDDGTINLINGILADIVENDQDLFTYFHCENHGKLPDSVDTCIHLYQMVREEQRVGEYYFENTPDEDNDVRGVLDQLLREETTNKQRDESRTHSPRRQLDFAMVLYNYSKGIYRPYEDEPKIIPEDTYEPSETFYEEDDFKDQYTEDELKNIDLEEEIASQGFAPTNPSNPGTFYHRK